MLRKARNLSLRLKGHLISAIAITVLLATAAIAVMAIENTRSHLTVISEETIPTITLLDDTEKSLLAAHMQLYRTISWMTNGIAGDAMTEQLAKTEAALSKINVLVADAERLGNNPIVLAAPELFSSYTASVRDALDMAAIDPSLATMLVMQANDSFAEVFELTEDLLTEQRANTDAQSASVSAAAKTSEWIFVALAAVAAVVTLAATFLVFRSIANPIVSITHAMQRLADDDLEVEIPDGASGAEISRMAQAMAVFRQNALDRRQLRAQQEAEHAAREAAERKAIEDRSAMDRQQAEMERLEREKAERHGRDSARLQNALAAVISSAKAGDFSQRVTEQFDDAGMRDVADSVNSLVATTQESLRHMIEFLGALASGDLTRRIDGQFSGDFELLKNDANSAASQLSSVLAMIIETAVGVNQESDAISESANALAHRTEMTAATLEETASALGEITISVQSAAKAASAAKQLVTGASGRAESSSAVVQDAVSAMGEIERMSHEISKTVSIINDIAFQTNLLALNAGVEAARAGETGRGFAVVASEVRALAQRAAEAAGEIGDMIGRSEKEVKRGVEFVARAGEALSEMATSIQEISHHVTDIASSSDEQSMGIGEINKAVNELDQATQQNAAMFEETNAASMGLASAATRMVEAMSRFKVGSERDALSDQGGVSVAAE